MQPRDSELRSSEAALLQLHMRTLASLVLGIAIAACAARSQKEPAPAAVPSRPESPSSMGVTPGASPRAELEILDDQITADMERLGIVRPQPAPDVCVADCEPQQMSTAVAAAAAQDPATCKRSGSQTCTDACALSDSICTNAKRICDLAAQLGGTDAYANDKCHRGTASCEAATKRCCSCL